MPKKTDAKFIVPLEELLEAGAHFGHQAKRWDPRMKEYLYGVREGVHIFDLVKTAQALQAGYDFVRDTVARGGAVVFVGTKRQGKDIIKEEAQRVGGYFVSERWLGGTITNWEQIKKSLDKLADMKQKKEAGEYKRYTKRENVLIDREITRLERFFGGLTGLKKIPDAVFVVDIIREVAAVKEANIRGVKVVAMVDSNANPAMVDYLIPANDDAVRSIKLIVAKMADAVAEGKAMAEKAAKVEEKKK